MRPESRYHRDELREPISDNPSHSRYSVTPPSSKVWQVGSTSVQYPPTSRRETPSRHQLHTPKEEWIAGDRIVVSRQRVGGNDAHRHRGSNRSDDFGSPSPPRRRETRSTVLPLRTSKVRSDRVADAHIDNTARWWVPNLVAKDRFEATAPRHLSCALCEDPALPFTVIAPCGHVVCKTCGDDSTRCPTCEDSISSRTVVCQMAGCVMASLSFECKTRRCTFSTLDPHEAFNHTCGAPAAEIQGDIRLRSASSASIKDTDAKSEVQAPQHDNAPRSTSSNPLDHIASWNIPVSPPVSVSSLLRTKQRKTMLFWDLDSMQPSFYGIAPHLFFRKLLGCLVTSCGVSSEVQSLVYCPDDIDSSVTSSLAELGAFTRVYPSEGLGKEAMTAAAVACVSVDVRQLIQSVLDDISHQQQQLAGGRYGSQPIESETMYDVVVVSAAARFIVGCRKLLCKVSQSQLRSPFFMHVVSDMTALPVSQKIEIQRGAVTYVDAADFTRERD
jgi:hypothetical protein